MILFSKLKHDQGREPNQQNWGILFPLILLITHEIFTVILLEFPTFLIYLTKISPFFEERLTKISPKYILRVGNELVITVVNISIIILVRYVLRIRYDTSFKQMGLSFSNFKKYLLYGGTIGIVKSTVIIIPILMIWPEYTEPYKKIDILQGASVLQGVSLFFCYFLGTIIAGPLCEEILFRGLFFSALRKYINLFWAILISACLFSFAHGFLPVMISAFLSAILLCFLYEKTRSLVLCITIHSVGNVFNNLYFILFSFIII